MSERCARVPANFTIVTLGVRDLDRSIAFYRALGWEQRGDEAEGICWFKTSGSWIGLFPHEDLVADMGLPRPAAAPSSTYRGITMAISVNSEEDVDAALVHAVSAGATMLKAATHTDWGGYSGYFVDPDGHPWEVARAPGFLVDEAGRIDIASS